MKNDRVHAFRQSVGKLVEMLTDKSVRVTQRGTDAYVKADPRTGAPVEVNIPHVPDNASDELLESINGFLDHEVAHIFFTDFGVVKRAMAKGGSIASMHNILEDARIERLMEEKFKGSAYNLGTMRAFFVRRMTMPLLKKAIGSGDSAQIVSVLVAPLIRSIYGQRVFQEFMTPEMLKLVEPFHTKMKHLEPEIVAMTTCEDALRVAEMIDAAVRVTGVKTTSGTHMDGREAPKKGEKSGDASTGRRKKTEEKRTSKKSKSKVEDERADELEAEEAEVEEKRLHDHKETPDEERAEEVAGEESDELTEEALVGEEPEDADEPKDFADPTAAASDDADPGERDFAEEGAGGTDDFDADPDLDPDRGMSSADYDRAMGAVGDFDSAMGKAIGSEAKTAAADAKYHVWTTDFDLIEPLPLRHTGPSHLKALEDSVNHLVSPMQKDLERIMAARSMATWSNGHRRGRLHGASLSRVLTGDDRVFRQRHETRSKDVAVSLLIDASGSMSGSRINVACQAAYALSQVLERIGIRHEVLAFTTKTELGGGKIPKHAMSHSEFSRWEPIYMPVLKGFDERLDSTTRARFAELPFCGLANNVDGECVEIAARRLLARREVGKKLLVLSDGEPCCNGPSTDQCENLRNVVKAVEASNVRCVGIGIQTTSVRSYYSRSVVLNDVTDLPNAVIRELKAALTD